MLRRISLLTAVPALAVLASGAVAAEPYVPVLTTQPVWFACGEKVDNARRAQAGPVPTWDTTKPTASVTTGAGCGNADTPFTQTASDNMYDTTWTGKYTGNLDSLTVDLHTIDVARSRVSGPATVQVRLVVDGEELTPGEIGTGVPVTVTPVRSSTGASDQLRFTVTGLGFLAEQEAGEHEITLLVNGGAVLQRGPTVTDAVHAFVWDASEVPAGLVFNPGTAEAVKVAAQRPAPVEE